ncbi:hypothetical protein K402DRAFT_409387 [Aulographum hederae CBS 113979]|uniref:MFS general substrate transporter n=1 Tax=Aulographum hederae CBS 113979 TaxID=1176131 RepID=A0A6G1HFM7_9PEZI|nr:hypothetical protein K402DRAFT_409387 [Aulographum hederae CBS 113979]
MPFLRFTTTRWQAATYLLGVALFSISFLVFLNSSVSFVITERIGQRERVGDAVGTLGFADELVALVACPLWGILSDRIGVRMVATLGYAIVGLSLFLFVQAENVYPQLLLGRLFFSLGGAATSTMVTAILPSMTYVAPPKPDDRAPNRITNGRHHITPSISSELTITPARFQSSPPQEQATVKKTSGESTSELAGIVGMFTGLGALVALGIFLPLPTNFQNGGASGSDAVAYSFYVVGTVALVVSVLCFLGLRNLPTEEHKGWKKLIVLIRQQKPEDGSAATDAKVMPYAKLFARSLTLGFQDVDIGLGYLGGFVARASSVAISLFIPLFVNNYFISSGLCEAGPGHSKDDIRQNCRRAYIIASVLTGTSQLVALLCAPVFGYLSGQYPRYNVPLLLASISGIVGYVAFGMLKSPEIGGKDGGPGVFFVVALLGISQIGAIVCSLGLLGRGIQNDESGSDHQAIGYGDARSGARSYADSTPAESPAVSSASRMDPLLEQAERTTQSESPMADEENSPLLPSGGGGLTSRQRSSKDESSSPTRARLKGSIAGMYSLYGGAGILLLTKVGGVLFDRLDPGAPFFVMAGFNALLLVAGVGYGFVEFIRLRDGRERERDREDTR